MEILKIVAGDYAANCYIVYCKDTREGIVIDPGGEIDRILQIINQKDLKIKYIVLTHGHGDHIGGANNLKELLNIPILAHEEEAGLLGDPNKNLSYMMSMGPMGLVPDKTLIEDSSIEFGRLNARVIHTPGHSEGGVCILIGNYLFTGDTLFKGSIGRTDLFGGDYQTLIDSIESKLLPLGDDIVILPGHGGESTIGSEKLFNDFLK